MNVKPVRITFLYSGYLVFAKHIQFVEKATRGIHPCEPYSLKLHKRDSIHLPGFRVHQLPGADEMHMGIIVESIAAGVDSGNDPRGPLLPEASRAEAEVLPVDLSGFFNHHFRLEAALKQPSSHGAREGESHMKVL